MVGLAVPVVAAPIVGPAFFAHHPAVFLVVFFAVSPAAGPQGQTAQNQNQSRRNAERVLRTLSDMGLPASRINFTAASSNQTTTNEVHLYVR